LSVPSDEMTKLLTHLEEPVYPSSAKSSGTTGIVVLNVVVDCTGKVESDTVVSGPTVFTGSAVSAVNNWTYKPYLVNGTAVKVQTVVTVTYSLGK
jgi:periplasmic protein TonB